MRVGEATFSRLRSDQFAGVGVEAGHDQTKRRRPVCILVVGIVVALGIVIVVGVLPVVEVGGVFAVVFVGGEAREARRPAGLDDLRRGLNLVKSTPLGAWQGPRPGLSDRRWRLWSVG